MVPMEKESSETPFVQELKQIAGVRFREGEPLARYTSMKIGGPADYFLDVDSREYDNVCQRNSWAAS